MQYYGQRATQALAGDPMARAELLSMYAPMGFLGTAGRAGKAAMTTRRTDDVVKRLREPMEDLPGFDMTQINALRAQRAKMLEEARGTETIRREALQQFDKQLAANKRRAMLQNLKNSAIQDTTALGVGGAAGFGFSEMAKALNDNVEKIKATRKLQK